MLGTSENGLYVDFYEAAGRVKRSLFSSVRFHFRRRLLRRHRPVSRGFIILLFALIRGAQHRGEALGLGVWAGAGIDEILSALHERLVVGSL